MCKMRAITYLLFVVLYQPPPQKKRKKKKNPPQFTLKIGKLLGNRVIFTYSVN